MDGNVLRHGVELHQKTAAASVQKPPALALAPVLEEEEEEESDDDDNDAGSDVDIDLTRLTIGESSAPSVSPSPSPVSASEYCGYSGSKTIRLNDFPQAFSHFTHRYNKSKLIVCDLQGVYDDKEKVFELTDPVIHYKSSQGRSAVYGRTDRGQKGINDFFRTHKCNDLCMLLKGHVSKNNPLPKQAKKGHGKSKKKGY